MTSTRHWSSCLALVALAACTTSPTKKAAPAPAPTPTTTATRPSMKVTSTAFDNGARLAPDFTCDESGDLPQLAWSNVPGGATSLAIVVDDPDAPTGDFVHWIVTDITPVGDGSPLTGPTRIANSAGVHGWSAPCPPHGGKVHHYRFTVYALRGAAPTSGSPAEAIAQIKKVAIAHGTLVGTYSR